MSTANMYGLRIVNGLRIMIPVRLFTLVNYIYIDSSYIVNVDSVFWLTDYYRV